MKKTFLLVVFIVLLAVLVVFGLRLLTDEDTWLCQNGQWVKHGNPNSPAPTTVCPGNTPGSWVCRNNEWTAVGNPTEPKPNTPCGTATTTQDHANLIVVDAPKPGAEISSPLVVTGQARGYWYFEASFPVKLYDGSGKQLAITPAQAQGEWMTENFVPFRAELEFSLPATDNGVLVLEKDNPSGLPENADEIRIPVKFKAGKPITVKIFFGNTKIDPGATDCSKTYAVQRTVAPTEAIGQAALEEMLKGPTAEEKAQGFFTSINDGVILKKLVIKNGIAEADFDQKLEEAVGGSCRVTAIRAQIETTLKQFSTVKDVSISINGRTGDILQP